MIRKSGVFGQELLSDHGMLFERFVLVGWEQFASVKEQSTMMINR
jgi:hypothetical protein